MRQIQLLLGALWIPVLLGVRSHCCCVHRGYVRSHCCCVHRGYVRSHSSDPTAAVCAMDTPGRPTPAVCAVETSDPTAFTMDASDHTAPVCAVDVCCVDVSDLTAAWMCQISLLRRCVRSHHAVCTVDMSSFHLLMHQAQGFFNTWQQEMNHLI